jgi:hypothetical protein
MDKTIAKIPIITLMQREVMLYFFIVLLKSVNMISV